MKKFPKLDEYSVDELIIVVYYESENWQKDAVTYAEQLLKNKGITESEAKKRLIELEKEAEIFYQKEFEARKVESYNFIDFFFLTLFWVKYVFRDWNLAKEGYVLKRKQRLICISIGIILYSILIFSSNTSYQQNNLRLNQLAQLDSIADSKIDWSGEYIFIDTSDIKKGKAIWQLKLNKIKNEHKGILVLINGTEKISINCVVLIKNDYLELYPDTTYKIFNSNEISYYDNLFSLININNEILTVWRKLRPYYSKKNNEIIFNKINAANNGS